MEREQSRTQAIAGASQDVVEAETAAAPTSYTTRGTIPPVSTEAHAASASASDRAYGHHGVPGGDRNVDMTGINTHHKDGSQATRLAIGGHTPKLVRSSAAYANDGSKVGDLAAGPVPINAGQICDLKIETKTVKCVFGHGAHPGWVPLHDFEHSAEIAQLQTQQAHQIDHERHAGHDLAKKGHAHVIYNKPTPAKYEQLFTKPHQQADTANHAHDYFIRGGGEANLLLNIPTWTPHGAGVGERFGSAVDLVKASEPGGPVLPESEFHQVAGPVEVPLYHRDSGVRVDHLSFVYGYLVNSAGEKRMGWINQYLLD